MGWSIIDLATAAMVAGGVGMLLSMRSRIGRILATFAFSGAAFVFAARPDPLFFGPQLSVVFGTLLGAAALAQLAQLRRKRPTQH